MTVREFIKIIPYSRFIGKSSSFFTYQRHGGRTERQKPTFLFCLTVKGIISSHEYTENCPTFKDDAT